MRAIAGSIGMMLDNSPQLQASIRSEWVVVVSRDEGYWRERFG